MNSNKNKNPKEMENVIKYLNNRGSRQLFKYDQYIDIDHYIGEVNGERTIKARPSNSMGYSSGIRKIQPFNYDYQPDRLREYLKDIRLEQWDINSIYKSTVIKDFCETPSTCKGVLAFTEKYGFIEYDIYKNIPYILVDTFLEIQREFKTISELLQSSRRYRDPVARRKEVEKLKAKGIIKLEYYFGLEMYQRLPEDVLKDEYEKYVNAITNIRDSLLNDPKHRPKVTHKSKWIESYDDFKKSRLTPYKLLIANNIYRESSNENEMDQLLNDDRELLNIIRKYCNGILVKHISCNAVLNAFQFEIIPNNLKSLMYLAIWKQNTRDIYKRQKCLYCGELFEKKRNNQLYCSREHKNRYHGNNQTPPKNPKP